MVPLKAIISADHVKRADKLCKILENPEKELVVENSSKQTQAKSEEFLFLKMLSDHASDASKVTRTYFSAYVKREIGAVYAISKMRLHSSVFLISASWGLFITFFRPNETNVYVKKIKSADPRYKLKITQLLTCHEEQVCYLLDPQKSLLFRFCLKSHRLMKCWNLDHLKIKFMVHWRPRKALVFISTDGSIYLSKWFSVGREISIENSYSSFRDIRVDFEKLSCFCVNESNSIVFLDKEGKRLLCLLLLDNGKSEIREVSIDFPNSEEIGLVTMKQLRIAIWLRNVKTHQVSTLLVYDLSGIVPVLERKCFLLSTSEEAIISCPENTFLRLFEDGRVALVTKNRFLLTILLFSNKKGEKPTLVKETKPGVVGQLIHPLCDGDSLWVFGSYLLVEKFCFGE